MSWKRRERWRRRTESGDGERAREGEPRRLEKTNRSAASNGSIDLDLLDCTICMDPLRPPVLQCTVGHVICSSCHGSLLNKDSCHMCTATGGYNRCIALDKILESFCVSCSNAVYGCTVKTLYYKAKDHRNLCPHAPCFCPGPACSFAGTTVKLLAHLTGDHKWKSREIMYNFKFTLLVKEGTWVIHARGHVPLFLVKFTLAPPFGNVASVLCVGPHATAEHRFRCCLRCSGPAMGQQKSSDFLVRSTTLSDGLQLTENDGSLLFASSTRSITAHIRDVVRDKRKRGMSIRLR
ncbi:E3 ubiquitin-protein ligase SINA-like 10 [Triticum dicoccoides]|uniref:E3 ubiquitin-protein ligase SINA-like 10 n=1 Tax=Triticum dicoccoides TaxID=85692 RepID=UPI00162B23DC|nr:E3 ubiquitin-protein ligase SINA-like 10 [Triticum dicoccoides]